MVKRRADNKTARTVRTIGAKSKSPPSKTSEKKRISTKKKSTKGTTPKSTTEARSDASSAPNRRPLKANPVSSGTRSSTKRSLEDELLAVGPTGATPHTSTAIKGTAKRISQKKATPPSSSKKRPKPSSSKSPRRKTPKTSPRNTSPSTARAKTPATEGTSDSEDDEFEHDNGIEYCDKAQCEGEAFTFCDGCDDYLCHAHRNNCGCGSGDERSEEDLTLASDNSDEGDDKPSDKDDDDDEEEDDIEDDDDDEDDEEEADSTDVDANSNDAAIVAILRATAATNKLMAETQKKQLKAKQQKLKTQKLKLVATQRQMNAQIAQELRTAVRDRNLAYEHQAKRVNVLTVSAANGVAVLKLLQTANKMIEPANNAHRTDRQTPRYQGAIKLCRDKLRDGGNNIKSMAEEFLRKQDPAADAHDWLVLCCAVIIKMGTNSTRMEMPYTLQDIAKTTPQIFPRGKNMISLEEYLATISETIDLVKWTATLVGATISEQEYDRINYYHFERLPVNITQMCKPSDTASVKKYAALWNKELQSGKIAGQQIWESCHSASAAASGKPRQQLVNCARHHNSRGIVAHIGAENSSQFKPDEQMTAPQEPPSGNHQRRHSDSGAGADSPARGDRGSHSAQRPSHRSESRDRDRDRDRNRDRDRDQDRDRDRDRGRTRHRDSDREHRGRDRSSRDQGARRDSHSSGSARPQYNSSNRQSNGHANGGHRSQHRQSPGGTNNRSAPTSDPTMCKRQGCNAKHKWYKCPYVVCRKCKGQGHLARECPQGRNNPAQHTHQFGAMPPQLPFPMMYPPPGAPTAAAPIGAIAPQQAIQAQTAANPTDGSCLNP